MNHPEAVTFRERHSYADSHTGIEVPISLSTQTGVSVHLMAKLDTGADFCIFRREYAEQLGIVVEDGRSQIFRTVTGTFNAFGHTLTLGCCGWEFDSEVFFAAMPDFRRDVVGRRGWLQNFRIGIIDHDSVLLLSQYDD